MVMGKINKEITGSLVHRDIDVLLSVDSLVSRIAKFLQVRETMNFLLSYG